jgi:hypothetical protein
MKIERFILIVLALNLLSCSVNVSRVGYLIDPNMEWFSIADSKNHLNESFGHSVAIDRKNNIYITGEYQKTIALGDFTLNQQIDLSDQGFIAKADENGNWLWAKNVNGVFPSFYSNTMVVDSHDNVYIAGYLKDSLFVEDVQIDLQGKAHIFIAKFAPSGELIWVESAFIAEKYGLSPGGLSINSKGIIYLSGNSSYTAHFGEHVIHGERKKREGFVATISPEGEWLSAEIIQHAEYDIRYIYDITIDNNDNVFLSGETGDRDAFIGKLDRNHKIQWIKPLDNGATIDDIFADSSGNIYLVGGSRGVTSFGHITIKKGEFDRYTFVAKLDNEGKFKWVNVATVAPLTIHYFRKIIVDEAGNCYVKGEFTESMKVGRRKLKIRNSLPRANTFIWILKPSGRTSMLKKIEFDSVFWPYSFALDNNKSLVFTGHFYEWGSFRGEIEWMMDIKNLFLAKYKP